VAPSGAAEENRRLVADELVAAAGENRRTPDQARPILLAVAGGESPHAAVVWEHAGKDFGTPFTSRIDETVDRSRFQCQSRLEKEKCLRNGFEKSNFGPWDFHLTAEKAMQSRTWLEA
jgi:hypothetical protein